MMDYSGDKWVMYDFEGSLKYMDRVIKAFTDGKIAYTLFDTETTSLNPWEGDVIMLSLFNDLEDRGVVIPLIINNSANPSWEKKYLKIDFTIEAHQKIKLMSKCREMLETIPIVGHNLKFDLKFCKVHMGIDLNKVKVFGDTIIMAHQRYNKMVSLSLKNLSRNLFDIKEEWEKEIKDYLDLYRLKKDSHYGNIPTGILCKYAALDVYYNDLLYKKLKGEIKRFQGILKSDVIVGVDKTVDLITNLIVPFSEAECVGVSCNRDIANFINNSLISSNNDLYSKILQFGEIKRFIDVKMGGLLKINLKKRVQLSVKELTDRCFNIGSNDDISMLLFSENYFSQTTDGIEVSKKTGKFSVDKASLNIISNRPDAPDSVKNFIQYLLQYKNNAKTISTYTSKILTETVDNTFKPEYNLIGTVTGRFSSGFHTMPKKSDIKRIFNSRWQSKGGLFLSADFSQLELRILASIANEDKMIDAFDRGEDLHSLTASVLFKKPLKDVNKSERGTAKSINFGIAYGMSPMALSQALNMSDDEAKKVFKDFFIGYPKIAFWVKLQQEFCLRHKYIRTATNRFIPIKELVCLDSLSTYKKKVAIDKAKRKAINYPIQGSASDVVAESYLETFKYIKANKMKTLFIGSVHDSVQYDVYPGEIFSLVNQIKKNSEKLSILKNGWIKCPLVMDIGLGTSWGGCLDLSIEKASCDSLVFKTEGLSKDIKMLFHTCNEAYNTSYEVIEVKKLLDTDFQKDNFVRDFDYWKVRFKIERKII